MENELEQIRSVLLQFGVKDKVAVSNIKYLVDQAFSAGIEAALGALGDIGNQAQPKHTHDPYDWGAGASSVLGQAKSAIEGLRVR